MSMSNPLRGYDAWKTRSDLDDYRGPDPDPEEPWDDMPAEAPEPDPIEEPEPEEPDQEPDEKPDLEEQIEAMLDAVAEERLSQCDCCGKMKAGCEDVVAYGLDTHACPQCRGYDPYDY
jgi:hypothetical protein